MPPMPLDPSDQPGETPAGAPVVEEEPIDELPEQLLWLLDAPLFIDESQVNAFYDAVLRPDYERASITLSNSITKDTTIGGTATVGANIPWLGKAEVEGSVDHSSGRESGRNSSYTAVSNAYRHLLALALHYAAPPALQPRLIIVSTTDGGESKAVDAAGKDVSNLWLHKEFVRALPRALVFLDLPPQTKLIPAALELTDFKVRVMADELATRLSKQVKEYPPDYPGSNAPEDDKDRYFDWFHDHGNDRIALKVLEDTVNDKSVSWVDFNVRVQKPPTTGRYLHLHIAARGHYDTGVFAYNLITRAFNYGVRLVGTLKSGPDLNVLAVFDS